MTLKELNEKKNELIARAEKLVNDAEMQTRNLSDDEKSEFNSINEEVRSIKEEIEKRAGGDFELKQGTFYSCLQRIVKQGYVTEYRTSNTPDGVRRKFYQLTEKGKVYIDENKDKYPITRYFYHKGIRFFELRTMEDDDKQGVPQKKEAE